MTIRRITSLATLAFLALGIAVAQNVLINGAGATFPYPMYSKWFDEYHKKFPTLQFNYQSIGSGGGIKQVTEGTVDFGATDGPMNDMQLKEFQDKRRSHILHFPTVMGADVPVYNLPGISGQLNFTPEALAGIFLGKIAKWNEGVSGQVQQTPNSLGYVELIYAVQNKIAYGKVKNLGGSFVQASLASVTAAAAGA